jgi:hypothetical protein
MCDLIVCWDRLTSHLHVLAHDEFHRLTKVLAPVTLLNILQVVVACSVVAVHVLQYLELGRPMRSDTLNINFKFMRVKVNFIPILLLSLSPASPKVESNISRSPLTSLV